jgi:hypothetical protein
MKRLAAPLLALIAGCSTAPVADVLDWLKPARLGPEKTPPYGGVCTPTPAGSPATLAPAPAPAVIPPPTSAPAAVLPPPPPAALGVSRGPLPPPDTTPAAATIAPPLPASGPGGLAPDSAPPR